MASPDQINHRSDLAGAPEKTMENINTVTLNTETTLFDQIVALGEDAGQIELEAVVKSHSIAEISAVDRVGQKISGSAERAIAALINYKMADAMEAAGGRHWSEVVYREVSDLAKALAPIMAEFFAAHKHVKNPSSKRARIEEMAYELSHPKIKADIGEEGAEGAEGEEGGDSATSRTRDEYARCVIEGGKLYRMLIAPDNDAKIKAHVHGDRLIAFLEHLTQGIKALGAPLEDEDLKAFMKSVK